MKDRLQIVHIDRDFSVFSLENDNWQKAKEIQVKTYWSGRAAPAGRHFGARLLWSETAFYVRFDARQTEPLILNETPDLARKTIGLWDRDVCEIFVAPNTNEREKYFEFEIAPTGEWIDLGIEVTPNERLTDWGYESGMRTAAKIESDRVLMAIKVDWSAFGMIPNAGDIWFGNLFRCVGNGTTRGYLSWKATKAATPYFHVPEAFGEFEFTK